MARLLLPPARRRRLLGAGLALWGAFASAVSSLTPRGARGLVFSPRPRVPPLPAKLGRIYRLKRVVRVLEPKKVKLDNLLASSRSFCKLPSAQRGPRSLYVGQKIDTRPLRPVTRKSAKIARRGLRTHRLLAAALGLRAAPGPRARADGWMPHWARAANRQHAHKNGRSLVWKDCSPTRTARRRSAPG